MEDSISDLNGGLAVVIFMSFSETSKFYKPFKNQSDLYRYMWFRYLLKFFRMLERRKYYHNKDVS